MKQPTNRYVRGFDRRRDEACYRSGLTKAEIAKKCGFNRKTLYSRNMNSLYLAKFCAVTHVSADWLLGLKER